MQFRNAFHANHRGTRAFNARPHFSQQRGQVLNFRLTRRILNHRFAVRQHGRHQHVFRAGDGDAVELHRRSLEAVGRFRFHISMRLTNAGAQLFQRGNMQIDGTRANGATTRHRNFRATRARH